MRQFAGKMIWRKLRLQVRIKTIPIGEDVEGVENQIFRPGERAPQTGIYEVRHYQHRFPHEVTALAREIFPLCRLCGHRASFRLVRAADRLKSDIDFKSAGNPLNSKTA